MKTIANLRGGYGFYFSYQTNSFFYSATFPTSIKYSKPKSISLTRMPFLCSGRAIRSSEAKLVGRKEQGSGIGVKGRGSVPAPVSSGKTVSPQVTKGTERKCDLFFSLCVLCVSSAASGKTAGYMRCAQRTLRLRMRTRS
jgi:hypothetical protein